MALRNKLCLASVILLLSGVSLSQSVLRVPSWAPPNSLDPHGTTDVNDQRVIAQIYEAPLALTIDSRGHFRLEPGLCQLPEISKDGRRLVLRMRANAHFAPNEVFPAGDGRPVVARDVLESLLRHADPRTRSPFFGPFLAGLIQGMDEWRSRSEESGIADYEAPPKGLALERDHLVITLTRRVPQFPALLSQVWASVVPMEAIRRHGSLIEKSAGSGPFLVDRRDALGTFYLKKNAKYWLGGRPRIDELRFVRLRTNEEQSERFAAGVLDVLNLLPQNDADYLASNGRLKSVHRRKGWRLVRTPPMEVSYIALSCKNAFLKKQKVRAAMMLALDRPKLARQVFGPRGELATSPIPKTFPEAREIARTEDPYGESDLARARKLLAEAGHPGGKGLPEFVFDVPGGATDGPTQEASKLMTSQWAKIGVKVQLRMESHARFLERNQGGQIQICWMRWYADYPDVENFLRLFYSKERFNYGRYHHPEYEKLFAQMCDLQPGVERSRLVGKMVNLLRADVAWIPLAWLGGANVLSSRVRGFRPSVLNWSLRDASLEAPKKR